MTKLARVFCFLVILGSSAVAAYAQTPIDSSSVIGDPTVAARDPSCPTDAYCVPITYDGTKSHYYGSIFDALTFLVPDPPGPLPNGSSYTCETGVSGDIFKHCLVIALPTPLFPLTDPIDFYGVLFWGGTLTPDEVVTLSSVGGPVEFDLPANFKGPKIIDLSPEPGTALLYMTGLVVLVGFVRKRFGANFLT